ncbi:MAG: hypothetical protein KF773_10855 [Deltaproteobacteria bacterium]|nr:hypothetical protein [Deltaproteobacteria bacterium]MCW5804667.1 hypothetical protein [Deltaproteobacteria bacterium]
MRAQLPRLTDRLPLGTRGLEVSPFCLGLTSDPATIVTAYEAGINFFFVSADMHWPLYEGTRRGLQLLFDAHPAARDEVVVAVVCYVTQPEFCWVPFEEVLEAVPQLGRIEVTLAGGSYGHEIERRLEVYRGHLETKHVGCRAIGATFHDRKAAIAPILEERLDIAYVRYNPQHPNARLDLFPHIGTRPARRPLVFNFKSTMGHIASDADYEALGIGADYWRPHVTDHYRFVLSEPALDGILCAFPHPRAVRDLADAMERGPMDEEDQQYLLDLGELSLGKATVKKSA